MSFIFNVARGAHGYYASLPGANDALIAVPIETTGIETEAVLKDYDTLAAVLAGTSNEQATMGRKTLTAVTATVDDVNDKRSIDAADIVWSAATGNACSLLLICYDPDTTASADANTIPLYGMDFLATPAGGDITYQVHASGFAES